MKLNSMTLKGLTVLTAACAALAVLPQPAHATTCSTKSCWIPTGHMGLLNNWWGVGSGVSGWQSIWLNSSTSWGTSWSWSGGSDYSVKTYAEMVDGWNWNSGGGAPFPYQVSGGHSVNVGWYFNNSNNGTQDVSFDCFFNPNPYPGGSNPTDEMMVWLQSNGGAGPLGSYKKNVTVDNWTWKLYQGYGAWNVVSYVVAYGNANGWSGNLMDFAQNAASNGYLSSSRYFLNVDTGTEIFHGSGSLTTTNFWAP